MTTPTLARNDLPGMAVWRALLLSLPIVFVASLGFVSMLMSKTAGLAGIVAGLITWVLCSAAFFMMLVTGKTHRYRSAMFILLGISLPFYFIPRMISTYGTVMLTPDVTYSGGAAFCPLTMPMVVLPALLKGVVIFPGELVAGATFFLIWLGSSLAVGRGWCSWGCFYGGWDELFSRLRKRTVIKHIDRKWTLLPFAILLAIVLLSALTYSPVYCQWLCPFKTITEFEAPTSAMTMVTFVIFIALFLGLVIMLPLLARKRIQCAIFCPFGAMQSLFNKINIFDVRIDPAKCTKCKACMRNCPTLSLDENSLSTGKPLLSCTKCAQCIDACPQGAVSYHIKGTPVGLRPATARLLFLYPAWMMYALMFAMITTSAFWRVILLVTTGSMI